MTTSRPASIKRILVANRGAIARRIVRACREMGIESVVVYSDADATAPYLAEATATCHLPGVLAQETYLNQAALLKAAAQNGADAVHPGYGFYSENAVFAAAVRDAGLVFIGPQTQWLSRMGDKVSARQLMAEHGFPVLPGTGLLNADQALSEVTRFVADHGYPILVKPSGGGGGMGMLPVREASELSSALARARAVATSAFADSGLYVEQLIDRPRHIKLQILADGNQARHAFERECSVQRRNQKLIEESPAPGINPDEVTQIAPPAAQICTMLGYDNLGTLETLFAGQGQFGFLEMNTRIQVEHGVTEAITGLDLVQLQIELAQGGQLPPTIERNGFAIEARIYAEDSMTLLPSTGTLSVFEVPMLHGVRVETGYQQGQQITPYYDAMLAKVIASGTTREMAIGRLLVALKAFTIRGVETNQALLLRVLGDDEFLAGRPHTGLVEQYFNNHI